MVEAALHGDLLDLRAAAFRGLSVLAADSADITGLCLGRLAQLMQGIQMRLGGSEKFFGDGLKHRSQSQ